MSNRPGLTSVLISNPILRLAVLPPAFLLVALSALAQTRPSESVAPCTTGEINQGIVVEGTAKNSEGEKAGMRAGDIILDWTRDDVNGKIESPFDLSEVETEQEPRGQVTLLGRRGGLKQAWAMGPDTWGIQARPSLPSTLLDIYNDGRVLAKAGRLSAAAERWRAAADASQKHKCSWISVWFLFHAAETLANARRWKDAGVQYEEAIRQASSATPEVRAQVIQTMSANYQQEPDLENAEKYRYEALKEIQISQSESLTGADCLNKLGIIVWSRGDLNKAEDYFRQALEIQNKLAPGSLGMSLSLNNLGNIELDRGDLDMAEEYYHRSLEIRQRLAPGRLDVSGSLNNLGNIEYERGNFDKAEASYRRSLEIRQRLAPVSLHVAASLNNLSNVAEQRGDLAEAEEYNLRALEIQKQLNPGTTAVALSLENLGDVGLERGELDKAENYYRQALAIHDKFAPTSLAVAGDMNNLGDVAKERRNLAKAEGYYRQSLTMLKKLAPSSFKTAEVLNNLGDIERDRHDLATASECYGQALEIRKKLAPESGGYAELLATLAGIAGDRQRTEEAGQLYAQAIDVLESQVAHLGGSSDIRAAFRAKHADYYSAYSDLLLTQGKLELAFQVLERSRARTLLETLAESHVSIRQGADPTLLERERTLQVNLAAKSSRKIELMGGKHTDEQLAAFNKEIDALLNQYQEVEGQIRTNSPNYAALTQPQPLTVKEIQQQLLDSGTVLLEYSLGEKRSFVFVVTPTSLDAYELPKRSEIDDAAHQVYDLLTSRNRWNEGESSSQRKDRLAKGEAEYRNRASTLSEMVLAPVAARLEGKRILIVADGVLQYLPFTVLPAPSRNGSAAAVPLVAEHEIVNLPSASVLALLRRQVNSRIAAPNEIAILADPVFDKDDSRVHNNSKNKQAAEPASAKETIPSIPEQLTRSLGDVGLASRRAGARLPRLAFSRQEADTIISMASVGKSMEALDFQASRETALNKDLGQYRIVHFATHGLLDNEHPELSGLVLSLVDHEGKSRNGFLDLEDVYNLNLPADLVVLSACETGLGKQITGEGLVGLTRGFMYAGASRVVASLWKVDDVATADLMGRLYQGILKDGLRPAAALRQAQLQMQAQKRWADPYYWAAFTIQGEWK